MRMRERGVHGKCPGCGVSVYSSPPTESDLGPNTVDIGDVIFQSMPCPKCGHELVYEFEREYPDFCDTCGHPYAEGIMHTFEIRRDGQTRWWCDDCQKKFCRRG